MPPVMAQIVTLCGSNYPCLKQIFMVPKGFEPSKFDCISCILQRFCKFAMLFTCCHSVNSFCFVADISIFTLESTSIIRKYISWLDIPWSCFAHTFPTVFVCTPRQFLRGWVCMLAIFFDIALKKMFRPQFLQGWDENSIRICFYTPI